MRADGPSNVGGGVHCCGCEDGDSQILRGPAG
ncbi:hypothetical protein BURMUCGD2M_3334 [Burkholderia multivorans CGD2M]|nr:hypothetical protein BURMUCGD2M_3334 [Burkholderia multivorans CGD2M]